ncbi:MAG: response regulator [Acidobacteria bacterium]|nr:response regulator [Acidobacteriota bacterium]
MAKILVVDDEPAIRAVLKEFLEKRNHEVFTASDGVEALEKICSENPKVVLLDIQMPGKSGLDVLEEIRRRNWNIGVIIVTAVEDEPVAGTALKGGAFDYITKPFDLEYLAKVLWWKLRLME